MTCHVLLHPGDEFGLKDDLIFCRQHFFEQQQQQQTSIGSTSVSTSFDPHLSSRMLDIGMENSHSHSINIPSGYLDDSGYYPSPMGTLISSTPPTNTSTPTGTVNGTKRTRKRKERLQTQQVLTVQTQQQQQQDEMINSSEHFLSLSPNSSNLGTFLFI